MIQEIKRRKLYEEVSEQITQLISSGEWKCGERIPTEAELSVQFGIGRNSIREAIKSLQLAGILQSSPGLGTFVSRNATEQLQNNTLIALLSDDQYMAELAETRYMLEAKLAYYAAERATTSQIQALHRVLNSMKKKDTKDSLLSDGFQFHSLLAESCGNRVLTELYRSISAKLLKQRNLEFLTLEVYQHDIGEHEKILEAIEQRQPQRAMQLMEEHLKRDYQTYLK